MIALIDGDILCYRCAFAAEKTKYVVLYPEADESIGHEFYNTFKDIPKDIPKEWIWSRKEVEPEELAIQATQATLQSILNKLGTDSYEIYLSDTFSFREKLATTARYKGNRDGQQRPVHYGVVRQALLREGACICPDQLEADDMLGIRGTGLGSECVIVSIDKDLLQIPGRHFNWVTDSYTEIDGREGCLRLGCQILSGDATDNVPGLPGIGEVKARKYLEGSTSTRDMVSRIQELYKAQRGEQGEQYLLEQGAMVYILRSRDDSFKKWYDKYAS